MSRVRGCHPVEPPVVEGGERPKVVKKRLKKLNIETSIRRRYGFSVFTSLQSASSYMPLTVRVNAILE